MIVVRSAPGARTIRLVAFAAGISACAMSHPGAREAAHYPAIDLASPLPYNVIGISSLNATGGMMLLDNRDRMEESFATCLNRRGIRTVAKHFAADEDKIRWRPRREPDDTAAIAIGKPLAVRGVLVIDVIEIRRIPESPVPGLNAMVIDARLIDREAGAVVWARKSGVLDLPGVPTAVWRANTASPPAEEGFTRAVCQFVESLSARAMPTRDIR